MKIPLNKCHKQFVYFSVKNMKFSIRWFRPKKIGQVWKNCVQNWVLKVEYLCVLNRSILFLFNELPKSFHIMITTKSLSFSINCLVSNMDWFWLHIQFKLGFKIIVYVWDVSTGMVKWIINDYVEKCDWHWRSRKHRSCSYDVLN